MPLQAITTDMEQTFGESVLKTLLTPQEIEDEKNALHPIAVLGAVCGCDVPG